MAQHLLDFLRSGLVAYGYWAVAAALLLENAGLPVPGETVLLMASFMAYSQHALRLPYIILIGTCAATAGDNIGFAVGKSGGRSMLDRYRHVFRISPRIILEGEAFFQRFGPLAVFFARFVFGMRVIAGPLAGVLRMDWKKFAIFNFLGAIVWVTVIATAGYLFGRNWDAVAHYLKRLDVAITVVLATLVFLWWRYGRRP